MQVDLLLKNIMFLNGQTGFLAIHAGRIAAMGPMSAISEASGSVFKISVDDPSGVAAGFMPGLSLGSASRPSTGSASGFSANFPCEFSATTVQNRPGCVAMPGLQNAHSHAAMSLLRGVGQGLDLQRWLFEAIFPAEDRLDDEAVYWGTRLSILEMLAGGTTRFCDMYMFMDSVAQAVADGGIRAELCRGVTGGANFDTKIQEALDFARRWQGGAEGRITTALGPHAEYTTAPHELRVVADLAGRHDLPVHIHCSETAGEVQGCRERHGLSPVAYLESLGLLTPKTRLAHCVHTTPEDWTLMRRAGALAVHVPGSNLYLGSGVAPTRAMLEAGVRLALGTDGPASDNRQDMFRALYLCAALPRQMDMAQAITPLQALCMGVSGGGISIGTKQETTIIFYDTQGQTADAAGGRAGFVDETAAATLAGLACDAHHEKSGTLFTLGQPADLCLVDTRRPALQPLQEPVAGMVFAACASDVVLTMVGGKILHQDGAFPGQDVEEIFQQAGRCAARLQGK